MILSRWFAASAKKYTTKAQTTLDQVDAAIRRWTDQIMQPTIGILDSMPQVIAGKAALARIEAAKMLAGGLQQAIQEIVVNPQGRAPGHTREQNLKTLSEQLDKLLNSIASSDKL